MKVTDQIMLMGAMMMAGESFGPRVFNNSKPKEPKNKYKLTPEDLELMSTMTPKEKKKFLRGKL